MNAMNETTEPARCIAACMHCHATCLETAVRHCLKAGGAHAQHDHMRLMLDCADLCATTADFGLRESDHFGAMCRVCCDVCDACAKSCDTLGETMHGCAQTCRDCADACRAHGR